MFPGPESEKINRRKIFSRFFSPKNFHWIFNEKSKNRKIAIFRFFGKFSKFSIFEIFIENSMKKNRTEKSRNYFSANFFSTFRPKKPPGFFLRPGMVMNHQDIIMRVPELIALNSRGWTSRKRGGSLGLATSLSLVIKFGQKNRAPAARCHFQIGFPYLSYLSLTFFTAPSAA